MEKLHEHEHSGHKYQRKIYISLGEYGMIVTIFRGKSPAELEEFSVSFTAEYNNMQLIIRRHCWMPSHDTFHTHVRRSISRRRFIKVYPPTLKGGVKRALNWAKRDMINNWYSYRKHFEKLLK